MVGSTSSRGTWTPGRPAAGSPGRRGRRRKATSAGLRTTAIPAMSTMTAKETNCAPGRNARLRLDRCLELSAERQEAVLIARAADQLDADREPVLRGCKRKADRRLPGAVERMGKAQPVEELVGRGIDVLA